MAERGAQLSSASGLNAQRPSIFEVLAQESLLAGIRPALKHTFRVLASHNPQKFGWVFSWSEEICTLLQLLLDGYHLKNYDASFSENFYGLKRVADIVDSTTESSSISTDNSAHRLNTASIAKSLLLLVGYPYVKSKCNELYERLSEQPNTAFQSTSQQNALSNILKKLLKLFVYLYPLLHSVIEAAVFIHQMAYVFNRACHHTPLLRLAGVTLTHLTPADIEQYEAGGASMPLLQELAGHSLLYKVMIVLKKLLRYTAILLSSGLSVSVFFLQFLDWWYSSDQRNNSLLSLPKPLPPTSHQADTLACNVPRLNNICPLCQKLRTNHTVLSVSGYVYCYTCIHRYVSQRSRCPVTGYPANITHLVKLYTTA